LTIQKINAPENIIPIIVDFPIEPGSTKMGQDVTVRLGKEDFKSLFDVSGVINGVNNSFERQLSRFRVFIHPDIVVPRELRPECMELVKQVTVSYLQKKQ